MTHSQAEVCDDAGGTPPQHLAYQRSRRSQKPVQQTENLLRHRAYDRENEHQAQQISIRTDHESRENEHLEAVEKTVRVELELQ